MIRAELFQFTKIIMNHFEQIQPEKKSIKPLSETSWLEEKVDICQEGELLPDYEEEQLRSELRERQEANKLKNEEAPRGGTEVLKVRVEKLEPADLCLFKKLTELENILLFSERVKGSKEEYKKYYKKFEELLNAHIAYLRERGEYDENRIELLAWLRNQALNFNLSSLDEIHSKRKLND